MRKYICGKNSVFDAIKAELPLEKIYIQNNHAMKLKTPVKVVVVSQEFLNKLVNENHQGYVAELKNFSYYDMSILKKDKPSRILILDHIHDPHNFGAILRTCNAANVQHILIAKDRQVDVTTTVLKVSSGGYIGLKIIKVTNLSRAIQLLKKMNFWIYAATIDNAISYKKIEFNHPYALVIGNEEKGVSHNILKASDQNVFIPMNGTVQSLNVSVATAILLFSNTD